MNLQFKTTALDNGLTIIAERAPDAGSMALGFIARTGSRDETDDIHGVSHFLEHMMFKGTERRTAFDVNREFDEMGANYNAFTSEEVTVYYAAVLPEFQARAVDLLADILRPSLRQDDFDTEKNVILEEIALYEDRPEFRLYENLMAEHFVGHPMGRSVLGTTESIRELTREAMLGYFTGRYSPNNMIVAATGNFDHDALLDQLNAACGGWASAEAPRDLPPGPTTRRSRAIVDAKLNRQHIGLMCPAPSAQSPQRYAAQVLAAILGDSTGSRLYYALVEPAIAEEASISYDPMDGVGAMIAFLTADPDRATQALRIAQEEFRRFLDEGPTEAELTAARNKFASATVLKGELPMGRLTAVGFEWLYLHSYTPLDEHVERILAVTAEEVMDVARQCGLTEWSMLSLGPNEQVG